jgi:xanthine/uracil permease
MMRTLCTFLVLSCVAGLSGVLIGHLWNRYADENGLLRLGGIYQRIVAAQAGFIDVAQGYWAATGAQDRLMPEASAFEE